MLLHFCYIATVFLNDPNLLNNSDFVSELFSLLSVYLCGVCGFITLPVIPFFSLSSVENVRCLGKYFISSNGSPA